MKKRADETGNPFSYFITRSVSLCLLLIFATFLVSTFVSALPSSLPIPLEAKDNASFFLKPNEGIQWMNDKDTFQISVQLIQEDKVLLNLYLSGETMRLFILKGLTVNLDVTNDTKADGSITLVDIVGDKAELKMASFAGEQAAAQPNVAATTPPTTTPPTTPGGATGTTPPPPAATQPPAATPPGTTTPTTPPAPVKKATVLQDNNRGTLVYGGSIVLIVIVIIVIGWIVWRRKPSS